MRLDLRQHRNEDGRLQASLVVTTNDTKTRIRVLEDSELQVEVTDRRSGDVLREETLTLKRELV